MKGRSVRERGYGPIVQALALCGIAFLLLPVVIVILFSFNDAAFFRWPPSGLSLRWYANLLRSPAFLRAGADSLAIAALVMPASLIVGLPTALALVRGHLPARRIIEALILSPLLVPGVITGIALLVLFSRTGPGDAFARLLIGLFLFTLPFSVRALVANLVGLDARMEEAARNLGASPWRAFLHVTLPQLKPGLLAAGIFVFVETIDNFSISVFLVDQQTTTLPVEAFEYIRDFDDPTIAALAALLILLSVLLVFAVERSIGFEKFLRL